MRQPHVDYAERPPLPVLVRHVACLWTQSVTGEGPPYVHRVVPDGCVDVIWQDGALHVAGPDTGPFLVALRPGSRLVGLRFRPGAAPAFDLPAAELRDARVDLSALWGAAAGRLAERLAAAPDAAAGTRVLEREVAARLPEAAPPDPVADAVVAEVRRPDPAPVAGLATRLGLSERQLRRRCVAAFGYGPKTLERVLRFHRAVCIVQAGRTANLADLAADLGYADQAHLAREVRLLAGVPMSRLAGQAGSRP